MEESSAHRQLKKVDILRYRVERIEHICALMSHEARIDFEKSYGGVLDLLKIYVDPAFIRVLIHFWSPSLHCFEFPQFDLVPTLEEYELMLRWPKSAGVYSYRGAHIAVDKVATLIKLPSHQSTLVGNGNIKGWKLKLLEDHLSSLAEKEDWSAFNKTLALIVFGTTLLPFHTDTVDHVAMDTFFDWDVHMRSPVLAILANTLLSVNICHQKQGKTLRCCSTLLYVWGITHFYASSHMGTLPDPLRSFPKIPHRRRYAMEWKAEVEHWSIDHFSWICHWFHPGDILIRCGDHPSVPLMGLRGCLAYSPKVAVRQLMRAQTVPSQEELGGLCFFLDSELQEKVDALTKKLEIKGAQLRALEDKEQESSFIIDGLQRQCKKKDQEIEQLKNECADFNEEAIRAAKV
ncbi:hypothetical protein Fmac_020971 [Flemingia macrophylla]|uniref:DUF7745 domain-containing protein n=1 Tax=Flemingia macrophylla TaxID=520843 RepID=A0ABD1LVH3_9FABA